jgi:hypothetical protein
LRGAALLANRASSFSLTTGSLAHEHSRSTASYTLDPDFFVDFEEQAEGARPHKIHLPGGDCTTEIFQ